MSGLKERIAAATQAVLVSSILRVQTPKPWWFRYILPVSAVGVATLAILLLHVLLVEEPPPFLFYFLAVFVSGFYSGRSGAIAAVLSVPAVIIFGFAPAGVMDVRFGKSLLAFLFLLESAFMVVVLSALRVALGESARRQQQLELLGRVGESLATGLEYDTALQEVAELAVGEFAAMCIIDLVEHERIERAVLVCSSHVDPAFAEGVRAATPDYHNDSDVISRVLRTNTAAFFPELGDPIRFARSEAHREVLASSQPVSAMSLPLAARGRVFGVLSFTRFAPKRPYTEEDFAFGQELAARVATRLDRAQLFEEAQRANLAKDEFLGMLSHELRTPITVISGGAQLLRRRREAMSGAEVEQMLTSIEEESSRLGGLFDNLLTLARIDGVEPPEMEPVTLDHFLEDQLETLKQRYPASGEVQLRLQKPLPLVTAVPTYFQQILRNLVTNAWKYSPAECPVEVDVSAAGDLVQVRVLDRGPGVDPAELELIFEQYYRSPSAQRKAAGFGVGLAVSRRLAELMGATLTAANRQGGGLELLLSLRPYSESPGSLEAGELNL